MKRNIQNYSTTIVLLVALMYLASATPVIAQPTPFLISGEVFKADGTPCNNPGVEITNTDTVEDWSAETHTTSNHYQLVLDTDDVDAGDTLRFDVSGCSQSKSVERTVTQDDIDSGGILDFDITLETTAPTDPLLCTNPDPPSHDFGSVPEGQTRTWTFYVTNCGGGTLEWTVNDNQDWITVSPTSGSATTETDTVTVTIDTTGLTAGATHEGTVTVGSNDGTKTGTISVSIPSAQVDPQLCTNPDPPSHNFGSVQQGQTRTWAFDITNCGGGTLEWTVNDNQDWITVSPASGSATTETDTVTVTIDTTGVASGATHTGTITVSSDGGTKTGVVSVYVQTPQPTKVPTLTPIGMLIMVGLLGIVAISSIRGIHVRKRE